MNKIVIEEFEIFPWNENLMIGIEEIDEQHKTIVRLVNKLANSLTQDEEFKIEDTFNELAEYAEFHFKSEEEIWKKYIKEEDLLITHKNSHDSFLPEVLKLRDKNKDKKFNVIVEEILLFLIRWLAFHIVDEDKRLALILRSLNEGKKISEAIYETDNLMSGSMKNLIDTILSMYDNLSSKTISLIREKKARVEAQRELLTINKKLEKLSITDQLTKLYNRRYFDDIFQRELDKSKRNKTVLSVILIDIDFFKKLNDTYGHAHGDDVLKTIAKCLREVCKRPNDFAFRVGGEEFTIVITNEDYNCVISLSNILQEKIHKLKIPNKDNGLSDYLTISGGIVSVVPEQKDTIDSIMKLADDRLYKAKETGRNKIVGE
jgi:diguanylate cyclase (GGDEF)-like protein/hemerythrin-like metal-binding protein